MDEEFQFKKIKLPKRKLELPDSPILDHLQKEPASKTKSADPKAKSSKPDDKIPSSDPDAMKAKLSTAIMVNQALGDLKSRKGCSLHAIKKYMGEKYNVDPDKIGFLIKRYLKSAVEKGDIVQTKGVGATGSFKLDSKAQKPKRTEKNKLEKTTNDDTKKKPKISEKKDSEKAKKETKKKTTKTTEAKENKKKEEKKKATKFSKDLKSPKKTTKGPQARRKSLGSIVKAPKMKPKTPKKPKIKKQTAA